MAKEENNVEALVPLSNMLIDLIIDTRIPLDIRREYTSRIEKEFPAVVLLSLDYIESKGLLSKLIGGIV